VFQPKDRIEAPPLSDKIVIRKGDNGESKQTVSAKIVLKNQLAIHGKKSSWAITHIPTGYRVNRSPYEHYEDALEVVTSLKKEYSPIIKSKTLESITKKYSKLSRAEKARLTVIIKRKKK